jgi:prolyl-tRNA editing enzyme YbaK/EbsC (Cys-tRNA(Pro) deacylase)
MILKKENDYHEVFAKIKLLLADHYWFETFEHEPVRTSEQASKIRTGYSIEQGAKALIVKGKYPGPSEKFSMVVVPGNQRFDNEKVKRVLGTKEIRFATEEEVIKLTGGVLPGGVPPLGNLFGMEVIVDPALLENEKIIFNAGDRRVSIAMFAVDYQRLAAPRIEEIIVS